MKTKTTKVAKQSARKPTSKKQNALATCPVGNAGWCAYPFSVAQLQKRMKRVAEEASDPKELATSGKGR